MFDPAPAQQVRNLCDAIHDALSVAEYPPASKGGQGGPAGASRPPMPTAVLDAKEDLKAKLVSWALMISEEAEVIIDCDDNTWSIAGWIYTKADWLGEHPAFDDFITEITEKVHDLQAPYLARADLEYCGEHQGEKIYVRRGQKTIELPDGTVEQVKTLKTWSHVQMLDVIDTPSRVAEIIAVFFGGQVTAKAITTAHSDDHNPERPHPSKILEPAIDDRGKKFYRVSDVMERFGMSPGAMKEPAVS